MCLHQWLSCPDFTQSLFSSKDLWSGESTFVCVSKAILTFRSLLSWCYWFGERVEETLLSLFLFTKSRGGEAVRIQSLLYICSLTEVGHIPPAQRAVGSQALFESTLKKQEVLDWKRNPKTKPKAKTQQQIRMTPCSYPPSRKESILGLSMQLSQGSWEEI